MSYCQFLDEMLSVSRNFTITNIYRLWAGLLQVALEQDPTTTSCDLSHGFHIAISKLFLDNMIWDALFYKGFYLLANLTDR